MKWRWSYVIEVVKVGVGVQLTTIIIIGLHLTKTANVDNSAYTSLIDTYYKLNKELYENWTRYKW